MSLNDVLILKILSQVKQKFALLFHMLGLTLWQEKLKTAWMYRVRIMYWYCKWKLLNHWFLVRNIKKVNNMISTSLKNTWFQKVTRAWLKKWACHADFKISGSRIEKGVAGSVFEPYPCNFRIWRIFYRCWNDISNIFSYLHCMNRIELRSSSEKI